MKISRVVYICEVCSKKHYIRPTNCRCEKCKNICLGQLEEQKSMLQEGKR